MTIHRLLYRSDCALAGAAGDVDRQVLEIVEASAIANRSAGLTGALLFASGVFIQVLEGPLEAIEATFERICGDLRHQRVQLLELTAAEDRLFGDWAMTRVTATQELARLCPSLATMESVRVEAATAAATIRLMRTLLLTEAGSGGKAAAAAV